MRWCTEMSRVCFYSRASTRQFFMEQIFMFKLILIQLGVHADLELVRR